MGRLSITSPNAKVQCHQFTSIHFNDHDPASKFLSHDLNSPPKKIHFKINERVKKITRPDNTTNLSIIMLSSTKKTIRPNNTNSLSSEPTPIQKLESTSSSKKEPHTSLEQAQFY